MEPHSGLAPLYAETTQERKPDAVAEERLADVPDSGRISSKN